MPFGAYRLTATNSPGMAVAADRNPWQDSSFAGRKVNTDFDLFDPDGDREAIKHGNTTVHREEGQNVLFLDGHLTFEKKASCAISDDNIYTWSDGTTDARRGGLPVLSASEPKRRTDSFLVTDGQGVRLDERSVIKK
jgi:prepilin-type processing-associated H-X9-DG protein